MQKSPSNWIKGIGLQCPPLICQITVNLPWHRMKSYLKRDKRRQERVGGWWWGPEGASISMQSLSAKPNSSPLLLVLPGDLSWLMSWVRRDTIRPVTYTASEWKTKIKKDLQQWRLFKVHSTLYSCIKKKKKRSNDKNWSSVNRTPLWHYSF